MSGRILYERKGRRYYPVGVANPEDLHGLYTPGTYVTVVTPGCRSTTRVEFPDEPQLAVAFVLARDRMAATIVAALRAGGSPNDAAEAAIRAALREDGEGELRKGAHGGSV
jgi:hypothetical protein